MPHSRNTSATRSRTFVLSASPCSSIGSPIAVMMGRRGFRELYGSWKMYCICGRKSRRLSRSRSNIFRPRNLTSPLVLFCSRRMVCPKVVLPEPDSPTKPTASPGNISKLTSLTPRTVWVVREKKPSCDTKYFLRCLTSTKGSSGFANAIGLSRESLRP